MLDFRHSDTARLYEYWRSPADGKPPHSRLWDPIQIPQLMPFVTILELNESNEFVHRFAGTGTCDFVGVELTGLCLKDLFSSAEEYATAAQELQSLLAAPCGLLSECIVRSASGHECHTELLTLPLTGTSGATDRLIVYMTVLETRGFGDAKPEVSPYIKAECIDLGFGVPDLLSTGALVS